MTRDEIKAIRPLIEQLPDFYQNSPEVVDLQNAFTKQINSAWMQREEFLNQLNVQTATWSLPIWEYLYGIEADTTRSLEFRRACILSKLRGNGTATLEMMKNVAKSFCNSDVEIIEYNDFIAFKTLFWNGNRKLQAGGDLQCQHLNGHPLLQMREKTYCLIFLSIIL